MHCATPPRTEEEPSSRATAQTKSSPAVTNAHGPSHAPPTGIFGRNLPQHQIARATASMAHVKPLPAATATQRRPTTSGGGPSSPSSSQPQHSKSPSFVTPQLWHPPLDAATARHPVMGVPAASEAVGTSICPREFSPQQCAASLASMAHVCVAPAESVGVSARASEAATARRHASRAASPARIAALKTSSRCQRGDERSDRRRAMRDRFVFACETFREMRDENERLLSRVKNK